MDTIDLIWNDFYEGNISLASAIKECRALIKFLKEV